MNGTYLELRSKIEVKLMMFRSVSDEDSLGDMMSYMDRTGYPYQLIGGDTEQDTMWDNDTIRQCFREAVIRDMQFLWAQLRHAAESEIRNYTRRANSSL